jgi:hypothetical protein
VKFTLPNLDRKVDFISPETTRSTAWYSSAPAAMMNKRLVLDPRARCAFCSERVTEVPARISWILPFLRDPIDDRYLGSESTGMVNDSQPLMTIRKPFSNPPCD